ncbi:MAG: BatB protein, partial [Rhodanobacter sp.]
MLEFAWPWIVVLLPLPWLLRRWLRPVAPTQALHLPQPGVSLVRVAAHVGAGVSPWLLGLAWLCLLAAAARPQWVGPPQSQQRSGRALMLAVDLSGSMQTDDMDLAGQR